MSVPEQTQNIEVPSESIIDSTSKATVIESILNSISKATTVTHLQSSAILIPRLSKPGREIPDYKKYYVPKFVSIGPYHFGKQELEYAETLKPVFAMKLLKDNVDTLKLLYDKLSERKMVQELRNFYEELQIADLDFSKMMLLDACFVLYAVNWNLEECKEVNRNQLVNVYQDLLLLENQIPFQALTEVMKLAEIEKDCLNGIEEFINLFSFVKKLRRKRRRLQNLKVIRSLPCFQNDPRFKGGDDHKDDEKLSHLLDAVHGKLTKIVKIPNANNSHKYDGSNFRNVSELVNVGISFKAIRETTSLTHIEFVKGWWGFSGNVKLPPITLYDHTNQLLLNMIAYEAYCFLDIHDAWVTSYVCLLDSLIDDVDDVRVLRKAWVIDNNLSSDKEVATLFNEIAKNLTPNYVAYLEAKGKIQTHYGSLRNTLFSQLKNEYFKSPWAIFALLGALMALFLTGVQTYFTIWSPESECDGLCKFLKMNHHL